MRHRIGDQRGRVVSALSGASLLAASAATRWGVFHPGLASAADPKFTVIPQRERARGPAQEPAGPGGRGRSGPRAQERAGRRGGTIG